MSKILKQKYEANASDNEWPIITKDFGIIERKMIKGISGYGFNNFDE